jgi:hypothetical protein
MPKTRVLTSDFQTAQIIRRSRRRPQKYAPSTRQTPESQLVSIESRVISWQNVDVEAPADQAPIQLGTLSPVASHVLFALLFVENWAV